MNIIFTIIVVTVLISFKGFDDHFFLEKYEFHMEVFAQVNKSDLYPSGFLHADISHLVI
jgi:hypothetical protein